MAAVNRPMLPPNPDEPPQWEDRHRWIAHRLVRHVAAARPAPDGFVPDKGMPLGQDIELTPGAYTYALIAPGEWPVASETALEAAGTELKAQSRRTEDSAEESKRLSNAVFDGGTWVGEGAEAASVHYKKQFDALLRLAQAQAAVGSDMTTLGDDVRRTKRDIRTAHDKAHAEIERMLRSQATMLGGPVGVVAIVAEHRPTISGLATKLDSWVAEKTAGLTRDFPETPPFDGDPRKGTGIGKDLPTDGSPGKKDDLNPPPAGGTKKDLPTAGGQSPAVGTQNGDGIGKALPSAGIASPPSASSPGRAVPSLPSTPASPLGGAASGGSGGGVGGPLSGLLGGGGPASGVANSVGNPASSVQGQTARAMQTAVGGEFGRGFAAGANTAGAMPFSPPPQSTPQTPPAPLAAPMGGSASPAAAPATTSAPVAPTAPAPAIASGGAPAGAGGPGGPMSSYGSVLSPAAPGGAGPVAGSTPAGVSGGPVPPGPTAGGGPGATSFVPVSRAGNAEPIPRSTSMSDLEVARREVADLAAASSVVYPGLEWAVGVARGSQGIPRYWIASNEGLGCYIPAGVYVPRSMPVAGDLNDGHWAGWFDPAETVLRVIEARGEQVSAIATNFPSRSRLIDEDRPDLKDVEVGVPPTAGGPDAAEASRHLQSRAHRLETVAPAVFHALSTAPSEVVRAYARQVTQRAVFTTTGPELSPVAQAVAQSVISGRWPSTEEWTAVRHEYESAHLMAGSQRPGLNGIHESHQLLTYQQDFTACRRLETVVCWENDTPADVVYAAWCAGVRVPLDRLERA